MKLSVREAKALGLLARCKFPDGEVRSGSNPDLHSSTLSAVVRKGLVSRRTRGDNYVYKITAAGRAEYNKTLPAHAEEWC